MSSRLNIRTSFKMLDLICIAFRYASRFYWPDSNISLLSGSMCTESIQLVDSKVSSHCACETSRPPISSPKEPSKINVNLVNKRYIFFVCVLYLLTSSSGLRRISLKSSFERRDSTFKLTITDGQTLISILQRLKNNLPWVSARIFWMR